jgi:8-oxo-dGTP pyrophosphatase MutT (NUDIX family)
MAAGDSPEETIIREAQEEIGVEISADELTYVDFVSDVVPMLPDKTHPEFCWVYTMHRDLDMEDLEVQQSELTEVKWMPIRELLADLKKPGHDQIYAARNPRVFAKALERIQHED